MRRVRRRVKDQPVRVMIQDNPLTNVDTTISLRAGDAPRFRDSGIPCCFDDGTDELIITADPADSTANTLNVDRAQDGTTGTEHAQNTPLLIRPRFTNAEILDRLASIVETELFPHVWLAGESSIDYQAANEYYEPVVPDIEEIDYAYQLSGGFRYPLHIDFLSRTLADDANFPNGAITVLDDTPDATKIYFAYKARPTIGSLSAGLENLTLMAVVADMVMAEEASHVGGDTSATQRRVEDGSRLRAGAVLWDRFEAARAQERIRLQSEEQERRAQIRGVGRVR
jgi:hypothetical protein